MSCPLGWNITETAKSGPIEPDVIDVECPMCGMAMRWSDGDQWWSCPWCRRKFSDEMIEIFDGEA